MSKGIQCRGTKRCPRITRCNAISIEAINVAGVEVAGGKPEVGCPVVRLGIIASIILSSCGHGLSGNSGEVSRFPWEAKTIVDRTGLSSVGTPLGCLAQGIKGWERCFD